MAEDSVQRKRQTAGLDPTLPSTAPKAPYNIEMTGGPEVPSKKRCRDYFYNRETGEYCGRTCKSWLYIISYGILYLMFLVTFTLVLLYLSLLLLKRLSDFKHMNPSPLMYPEGGIGLTATPTSEDIYPLIWYKHGEKDDFDKYVQAIDKLLLNNRKTRDVDNLGPCGQAPYGYGENPCVIIKINKHFQWSGKPLQLNSTAMQLAPPEVKKWMKADKNKLWLQCRGYHSYDKEHIGSIKYYPDPPGFDPELFPLGTEGRSPLVAIQISDFTKGISLAIECKLWYESGPSTVEFVLYVAPDDSISFAGHTSINV